MSCFYFDIKSNMHALWFYELKTLVGIQSVVNPSEKN